MKSLDLRHQNTTQSDLGLWSLLLLHCKADTHTALPIIMYRPRLVLLVSCYLSLESGFNQCVPNLSLAMFGTAVATLKHGSLNCAQMKIGEASSKLRSRISDALLVLAVPNRASIPYYMMILEPRCPNHNLN